MITNEYGAGGRGQQAQVGCHDGACQVVASDNSPPALIETIDINAPKHGVQVLVRKDRKTLWVNVDGVCVLRICQIPELEIDEP